MKQGSFSRLTTLLGLAKSRKTSQQRQRNNRKLLIEGLEKREVFAAFAAGNLVVERIGAIGSSTTLAGGAAIAVFVDEFTTAAGQSGLSPVQSISLPTTVSSVAGSQRALVDSGSATSAGFLTRSVDGRFLVLPGVNAAPGTASVATAAGLDRVVGRIDVSGNVDTTTVLTGAFVGNNFRSVATTNGTDIWVAGTSSGTGSPTGGVWYTTFGGSTPTQLTTGPGAPAVGGGNARNVVVTSSGLYVSTGSTSLNGGPVALGVLQVGTGVPTTSGQSLTQLVNTSTTGTGTASPYDFAISNDGLTMYVADDRTIANGGGIQKFTRTSTANTFALAYAIGTGTGSTVGARSIAVDFSGANPIIVASTSEASLNRIIRLTDTGTQSGANATVVTVSTATANTIYRGVDFAPANAPVAPTLGTVSVNGGDTFLNPNQRSMLTSLVLNFSAPITVTSSDFSVENIGLVTAQTPVPLATSQIIVSGSGTNQITLRWGSGSGVNTRTGGVSGTDTSRGNSLADGNWRVTIRQTLVTGNNVYGNTSSEGFFRLYGDSNGDGRVDALDTNAMRAALGNALNAAFDFDGNGTTSTGVDTINFGSNNGKRRRSF